MLPPKSHPAWKRLVTGELTHAFQLVSAGMCVSRNVRAVQAQGKSPQAVDAAVEEVRAFFQRYENILQNDITRIFG